jgi:hypothetical protein
MNLAIKNNFLILGAYFWFIGMVIFCLSNNTAKISEIALSNFALISKTKYIFSSCLIALALVVLYFQERFDFKGITRQWLVYAIRYGSVISSLSLVVVALIDMSSPIHSYFAAIYFLIMPILSFLFGIIYKIRGSNTLGNYLIIIGVSNFVISFILFRFVHSLLIAECVHTHFIFIYVFLINKQK